jgi:carboxymethylenebutenolidase
MNLEDVDPQNVTKADVSRRGFVKLGAGAALVLANVSELDAQTVAFGKPHPPIVPEDDPAIATSRPQLVPKAGSPIGSYAAMPRTITQTTPGVVVVQQIWGVDAQLRDVVRRFAKNGFIAIAPALFDRLNPPNGDGATDIAPFSAIAAQASAQGFYPTDVLAAHDWIQTQARDASLGIIGFCMGGGIALQAIIDSKAFAAASMFYGSVRPGTNPKDPTNATTFDFTSRITTPLMGSFGARDASINPDDVRAMFARLTSPHDVKIYDEAGHAFFDDTRARYVPSAASDAWTRTITWFHKYLG